MNSPVGMRICACSIAWQQLGRWDDEPVIQVPLIEVLPTLAAWGYDGVEIWEPHSRSAEPDNGTGLRAALAAAGLSVPMLSGYFNFTRSAAEAAASLAHGHRVLARARAIGAAAIRIFTGNHRGGDASPEQWDRCVGCLQELADAAAADGIRLAAELHDWNLMDTVDNALRLIGRIDRPNAGLIFHPSLLAPDPLPGLRRLAPHVFHVHCTNPGGTLASGSIDYPALIAALHAIGYDGWLSVEHFAADYAERLPMERDYLAGRLAVVQG
jgi:sugar phosphate isomerase/epimerase